MLIVNKKELKNKEILEKIIAWFMGYTIIWGSKWIIVDLLYNKNIVGDAINAIKIRTSTKNTNLLYVIINNFMFVSFESMILFFISILCFIKGKINKININKKEILQYIAIGLLPIIWFIFTQNHSFIHSFFTYRNLMITFLGFGIADYKIMEKSRKK